MIGRRVHDRVRDRELALVDAEVALHGEPDPVPVLHRQRPVEQVLVPDRREHGRVAVLGAERDRRVARDRADADEDEHAREHEHDEGGSHLAQEEAAHRQSVSMTSSYLNDAIATRSSVSGYIVDARQLSSGHRRG